ncbi:MAG: hypothetical protein QXN55_01140 [Candidatus Nitrosotenuis sp.]
MSLITEAFINRKFAKGVVKFKKHALNDPEIQAVIDHAAKELKKSKSEILDEINDKVDKFKKYAAKAPFLFSTILENVVEQTLFEMYEDYAINTPGPKFNAVIFRKLVRYIKAEHDTFFPLRSFIKSTYLYDPPIILLPNAKYEAESEQIKTAAADKQGNFYFNVPFMQNLMNYAHIKKVHPAGKKYQSNGGDIPDEYCYIEFVIMHEFMHYSYDDFYYNDIIKDNSISKNFKMKIINYVGDFRTNYLLVKSGFEQLPMGLFNDDINYDRQKSYQEMYDIVKDELLKLNDKDREELEKMLDNMSDDHEPGNEGQEGDGNGDDDGKDDKSSKKSSKKGKGGAGGDESGDEPSEKEGNGEGNGDGDGKDRGKGKINKTLEDIEKRHKEIEDAMQKGEDKDAHEVEDHRRQENNKKNIKSGSNFGDGTKHGDAKIGIDYSKEHARFDWEELLANVVKSTGLNTVEVYGKHNRRNMQAIAQADDTGAAAVFPTEVQEEYIDAKFAFIIDSSGSMSSYIEQVYANVHSLFTEHSALAKAEFFLVKFSSNYQIFKCIFNENKAALLNKIDATPNFDKELHSVFTTHFGGGTNFSGEVAHIGRRLLEDGYNVIVMSDSDICGGGNLEDLVTMLNFPNGKAYVIFATRGDWITFRQAAREQYPEQVTYINSSLDKNKK